MKRLASSSLICFFASIALVACLTATAAAQETKPHSAITPVPRGGGWMNRHKNYNARVAKGSADLLFIGDSISGNYDRGLRTALAGKFNLHHPPTNCGPSGKGAKSIVNWLGAYDQPGRHWDVISFNHGHWDSKNDKANYQANLEKIISELKKAKANLAKADHGVASMDHRCGFPLHVRTFHSIAIDRDLM